MIPGKDSRKSNSADAELDALVAREVDALTQRQARTSQKARAAYDMAEPVPATREHGPPSTTIELDAHRASDTGRRPGRTRQGADNVIGIRHGGLPGAGVLVFSAEEEAFIEGAVAFLRERANADVIIEEVWTHAVLDREESVDETHEQNAPVIDEIAAAEDGEQVVEPDAGDAVASPLEHEQVMPLEPPVSRPRTRNSAGSNKAEPAQAKPSTPAQGGSRGKQKRENDNGEDAP
jgi:hypothetical protein